MIKLDKIIIILIVSLTFFTTMASQTISVEASTASDTKYEFYNPNNAEDISGEKFNTAAGKVVGYVRTIGILIAVIALVVIGIKYIFASIEGKADYKKAMIPYVIGCLFIIGTSTIIGMVGDIVGDITIKASSISSEDDYSDNEYWGNIKYAIGQYTNEFNKYQNDDAAIDWFKDQHYYMQYRQSLSEDKRKEFDYKVYNAMNWFKKQGSDDATAKAEILNNYLKYISSL